MSFVLCQSFFLQVMASACSGTGAPSYAAKNLVGKEGFSEISASEIHDSRPFLRIFHSSVVGVIYIKLWFYEVLFYTT